MRFPSLQLEDFTSMERSTKYANHSKKPTSRKHIDQLKESNLQLKNVSILPKWWQIQPFLIFEIYLQKIAQLQMVNTDQEAKIGELKDHLINELTPRKLNISINGSGTPKTPRTPKKYRGKENQHEVVSVSPSPNVLRSRNQWLKWSNI